MNTGMRKRIALLAACTSLALVSGCTGGVGADSKIEQGPVGIGRSVNELKGTPCACMEIPMSIPAQMKV